MTANFVDKPGRLSYLSYLRYCYSAHNRY